MYSWKRQFSRPMSVSISQRRGNIHCGLSKRLSVNDAIFGITETPLSVHTDITQPSTTATLTHNTARLLQHSHSVHRSAHCLCGGLVDNVANLCPSHDPTLLLWLVFFPLNQTRWFSRGMREGGGEGGVLCSAWHWGRECEEGTAYQSVTLAQSLWWSWADMWTSYMHTQYPAKMSTTLLLSLQWVLHSGSLCFFMVGSMLSFCLQREVRIFYHLHWEEVHPWKPLSHFAWKEISLKLEYFYVKQHLFYKMKQQDQTTSKLTIVMHWLRMSDGIHMDRHQVSNCFQRSWVSIVVANNRKPWLWNTICQD